MDWEVQADKLDYQARESACKERGSLFPPVNYDSFLTGRGEVFVIRDDLLCGGTKSRYLYSLLDRKFDEYIYVSGWYGGAQIALAWTIALINKLEGRKKKAVIITDNLEGGEPKAYTKVAIDLGAEMIYDSLSKSKNYLADELLRKKDGVKRALLPSGFLSKVMLDEIAGTSSQIAGTLGIFDECWCAVGSGALIRGLQMGGIARRYYGVCVYGTCPDIGIAAPIFPNTLINSVVPKEEAPPFTSASHYDAKVWKFVQNRPGRILFWNVM